MLALLNMHISLKEKMASLNLNVKLKLHFDHYTIFGGVDALAFHKMFTNCYPGSEINSSVNECRIQPEN